MLAQLGLMCAVFLVAAVVFSVNHGVATAFGASLAMVNTIFSRRSIKKASELAYTQPDLGMLPVFSGLLQRMTVFAAGFSGGVLLFGLLPLPILAGFALAQLGYLACRMS